MLSVQRVKPLFVCLFCSCQFCSVETQPYPKCRLMVSQIHSSCWQHRPQWQTQWRGLGTSATVCTSPLRRAKRRRRWTSRRNPSAGNIRLVHHLPLHTLQLPLSPSLPPSVPLPPSLPPSHSLPLPSLSHTTERPLEHVCSERCQFQERAHEPKHLRTLPWLSPRGSDQEQRHRWEQEGYRYQGRERDQTSQRPVVLGGGGALQEPGWYSECCQDKRDSHPRRRHHGVQEGTRYCQLLHRLSRVT